MAGSSIKTSAMAAGIALGSSGAVILICTIFIGMLVLALIPIYSPNNSAAGYGEVYRIPGIVIKAIYTNLTSLNFTGGNVLNLGALSSICTSILRAKNTNGFYACIATNFTAFGPTGDTSGTTAFFRRRALNDVGLYEIGDILLLYSNTCGNTRALNRLFTSLTSSQNSSCLAQRASTCRNFITTPNNASLGNLWSPFPVGYSQVVYANNTGCASISISSIFNVPAGLYSSLITSIINPRFNLTRTVIGPGDCQLYSILSQSDLKALVDSANSPPFSNCTSVLYG